MTTFARQMLENHPSPSKLSINAVSDCIQSCFECSQVCTSCADACLSENNVGQLLRCIRLDLDCSDVCVTTGKMLTRQTQPDLGLLRAQLQVCLDACRICADECQKHAAHHEHCRICAEECTRCQQACKQALGALA